MLADVFLVFFFAQAILNGLMISANVSRLMPVNRENSSANNFFILSDFIAKPLTEITQRATLIHC